MERWTWWRSTGVFSKYRYVDRETSLNEAKLHLVIIDEDITQALICSNGEVIQKISFVTSTGRFTFIRSSIVADLHRSPVNLVWHRRSTPHRLRARGKGVGGICRRHCAVRQRPSGLRYNEQLKRVLIVSSIAIVE